MIKMLQIPNRDYWEFQRVFLKSTNGYVPVILANSVMDAVHFQTNAEWHLIDGMVNCTRREMLVAAGSYPELLALHEFWTHNGLLLDSNTICQWIDTGCQFAVTIEEFLAVNPNTRCEAGLCHEQEAKKTKIGMREIQTTQDLNNWLEETDTFSPLRYLNFVEKEHRRFKIPDPDRLVLPKKDPLSDSVYMRTISYNGLYFDGFLYPETPHFREKDFAKYMSGDEANRIAFKLRCSGIPARDISINKEERTLA